jgi:hypothetical protein
LATGRFAPGTSGNPGGRPRGLARTVRELVGDDGDTIVAFWLEVMNDPTARTSDRLEASKLLAERGWGKPTLPVAAVEPTPDDDAHSKEVLRWPSPERMLELARIAREMGDDGKALSYEVWANDALAAGAPFDQPVDPAVAPSPTVGRIALLLAEQAGEQRLAGKVLPNLLPTVPI